MPDTKNYGAQAHKELEQAMGAGRKQHVIAEGLTLNEALLAANVATTLDAILVKKDGKYALLEMPKGALLFTRGGRMPIPITDEGAKILGTLVENAMDGKVAKPLGKNIKRRTV